MTPLKPPKKRVIDPASVVPYDLTAPKPIMVAKMKALEAAHERFARASTHSLGLHLSHPTNVAVISTDALRFKDFAAGVAWPAGAAMLKLDDKTSGASRGALFVFDNALVLHLVEALFGAQAQKAQTVSAPHALTRIELSVVQDLARAMTADLNAGWAGVLPLVAAFDRMESDPKFITGVQPDEAVVVTTFRLAVDKAVGAFSLALPYAALKPYEKRLTADL